MSIIDKIKKRYGLESNIQLTIIFIVFAITGSSVMYVRKFIFEIIGITDDTPLYFVVPLYIITIIPAYQILLLFWGFVFRQFDFFWNFQKKSFSRFLPKNKK